jgi:hypothetical protein
VKESLASQVGVGLRCRSLTVILTSVVPGSTLLGNETEVSKGGGRREQAKGASLTPGECRE